MDIDWIDLLGTIWSVAYNFIDKHAPLVMAISAIASAIIIGYLLKVAIEATIAGMHHTYGKLKALPNVYHKIRKYFKKTKVGASFMAKWERGKVSQIIHDALFEANLRGEITNAQYNRWTRMVGKLLGLPDLLPKKLHKAYLRSHFFGDDKHPPRYQKLAGPVKKIPGPDTVSAVVSHSKFLAKQRGKAA